MDNVDIDVENLFNDGQLDQILPSEHALQTSTLAVPGVAEHYLNLRFCGGFSRASWSRQGHIAIISDDGSSVTVQCLRAGSISSQWKLSSPRRLEAVFENAMNILWSPAGFDLAITDNTGRVGIYSMTTTCVNRLNESKSALTDASDNMGMPVGTWWMNQDRQDRPRNVVSVARKEGDRWIHDMTKAKALGPLYPRAFCMINRQGTFILTYQRPGARYSRTSVDLPLMPNTTCSHAAFSPTTESKILTAVYTTKGNLAIYHVQVTWPQDLMTDPTSTTQPVLTIEVIDSCVSMWAEEDGTNGGLSQTYKPDDWSLTHLVIVPTSDVENAVHEPPCVWAVFTSTNSGISASDGGFLLNSVIRRWSVYPSTRSLHARFDDIPTKKESSPQDDNMYTVDRLTDLIMTHAVLAIELLDGGQTIAISMADGRTEIWNPITQTLVSYEGQTSEITSLAQFGFAFPPAANAISTFLSPNSCTSLTLTDELKPSIQHLQYPIQNASQDLDLTDPHQSACVAAAILAFSRSCWSNTNGDDVLACFLANFATNQYSTVLSEMYRTFFRDTEFIHEKAPGSEVERLVSKPLVIKVLSFQMSLLNCNSMSVTSNDENIRFAALGSVWAWLAINLRYIATIFYIFYREYQTTMQAQQNPNQAPPPPLSASFADAICNTIHWTLDLFRFMFTTILEIGDRQTNPDFFTPPTFANNLGDAKGDGTQGLVALILNCQWSRGFLSAISRAMRAFIDSNEKGHSPHIARVVHTIRRYSIGKGMNITAIDKLLDPRWYTRNGLREGEQMNNETLAKRQIAMYCSGRVGPEYAGTLRMLLNKVINDPTTGLRATGELERLKLWTDTPDLNWLLMGFNPQFYAETQSSSVTAYALSNTTNIQGTAPQRKLYDVHRKSSVVVTGSPDQLVRRCVRCGSVSGDVDGVDKSWSKAMVGYLARCVCDAYWILEPISGEEERGRT